MNWSLEVIIFFASFGIMLGNLGIMISLYLKKKEHQYLIYLLFIIFLTLYTFAGAMQYLLLSVVIFKIQMLFIIITCFFSLYSLDYMARYSIDPLKMLILGVISCGLIISSNDPNAIILTTLSTGDPTLKASGAFQIWGIFTTIGAIGPFFIFTLKIYLKTPEKMKSKALIMLVGGILFGLFPFFFYIFQLTAIIPGILGLTTSLGTILVTIAFKLEPKLVHVLVEYSNRAKFKLINKIVPICSYCKKVKNLDGNWISIEQFFFHNSNMKFSHAICNECLSSNFSQSVEQEKELDEGYTEPK